jgi:membrane-associated progesterone receptor component
MLFFLSQSHCPLLFVVRYDGSDPSLPIYIAVHGIVYDVTNGGAYYGKGGSYEVFAGRVCTRALALSTLDEKDLVDHIEGVTEKQLADLKTWSRFFDKKYKRVGVMVAAE